MIKQMQIRTPRTFGGKSVLMAQLIEEAVKKHGVERVMYLTDHQDRRAQLVRRLSSDIGDRVLLAGIERLPKFLPDDLVILDEIPSVTEFLIETRLKNESVRVISFRQGAL